MPGPPVRGGQAPAAPAQASGATYWAAVTQDWLSRPTRRILFTRVAGYEGSGWPTSSAPKRYHLCLRAADMTAAVRRCLELGAGKPDFQPGGDRWTVLIDPSGHPFCLGKAE